jgi:cytochrome c biogenesis protein CcmG/thiol:disulfide interchange protein DsbE
MKVKHVLYFLPLLICLGLCYFFFRGLSLDPKALPSTFLNKEAPTFSLRVLSNEEKLATNEQFKGQVWLLNVWGSWCESCINEHAFLLGLRESIPVVGLNYKDSPKNARDYLNKYGNPYQTVLLDESGEATIDWGIYGTPETFLIDKKGVIQYRYAGTLNQTVWQTSFLPIIKRINHDK